MGDFLGWIAKSSARVDRSQSVDAETVTLGSHTLENCLPVRSEDQAEDGMGRSNLMHLHLAAAQKSESHRKFTPGRYSWSEVLDQLRDEIAVLLTMGLDRTEIARKLDISEADVRALGPKIRTGVMRRDLSRRAVIALLNGRHAHLSGRTVGNRVQRLIRIASSYTREELLMEPGVGIVTAIEIELWLEKRGCSLVKEFVADDGIDRVATNPMC